jgi:hypothetical protein
MIVIQQNDREQQEQLQAQIAKENLIKELKARNQVRINTKYTKREILCINDYPEGWSYDAIEKRKEFKYYCPICLRYFNHILISNCCNNYICRFCIGL